MSDLGREGGDSSARDAPYAPFLRDERPGDQELADEAATLAEQLETLDDVARIRAEGRLGELLRILGRIDQAEPHLRAARDAAVAADERDDEIVNRLRLATALQYQGAHPEALAELDVAETVISENGLASEYQDFAAEHRGKCLVEMGRLEEGRAALEQALQLREERGDPELLASTDVALELAQELE